MLPSPQTPPRARAGCKVLPACDTLEWVSVGGLGEPDPQRCYSPLLLTPREAGKTDVEADVSDTIPQIWSENNGPQTWKLTPRLTTGRRACCSTQSVLTLPLEAPPRPAYTYDHQGSGSQATRLWGTAPGSGIYSSPGSMHPPERGAWSEGGTHQQTPA